ncbi:LOW QUALITY PROTEIN: hypothetical protein MXB_3059 [Myxobolus squamalis]|nr:LOW QUALITY PROTEIN: hypothetical protein MXB_3059 [Myxobolus squamalis]
MNSAETLVVMFQSQLSLMALGKLKSTFTVFDDEGDESESEEDKESTKDAEASLQLLGVFLDKENFCSENEEYK